MWEQYQYKVQGFDLNSLAQDRNLWWILANRVLNISVPQKMENFLPSWGVIYMKKVRESDVGSQMFYYKKLHNIKQAQKMETGNMLKSLHSQDHIVCLAVYWNRKKIPLIDVPSSLLWHYIKYNNNGNHNFQNDIKEVQFIPCTKSVCWADVIIIIHHYPTESF